MKKTVPFLIIILLILFTSCEKAEQKDKTFIKVNGDIKGIHLNIDYNSLDIKEYKIQDDTITGVLLSEVLSKTTFIQKENVNYIMITAKDGTSALIDSESSEKCYVVFDDGRLNIKAPEHPRVVGIKDISEITVIADEEVKLPDGAGIRVVSEEENKQISYGNTKLLFYDKSGENRQNGNLAVKYVKKALVTVNDFIGDEGILYLENYDIIKANETNTGVVVWEDGKVYFKESERNNSPIVGIVKGTNTVIYDTYYKIKELIDKNEKVLFFLTDGYSYQQAEYYKESLSLFAQNNIKTVSVNPAISNVALASIVTGKSPYYTDITERNIKEPRCQDIFAYATVKGKKVAYIEGNANLIITSTKPKLNAIDKAGYSDYNVYLSTIEAIKEKPDLLLVHFHGIDEANHEYSPISEEAKEKIIEIEEYITDLIKKYKGNVIIVSDHGSVTLNDNEIKTGKHGMFMNEDMFVPYYFFERGSLNEG